jgi:CheY-like chemotaxis protein
MDVKELGAADQAARDHKPAADIVARFLVIDDDPVHRMVICKVGEKLGYAVSVAGCVTEAAPLIEQCKFRCISLDLSLAGQSGSALLGHVSTFNPEALLIVISGASTDTREETLALARSLHIDVAEIPKPANLGTLRNMLMGKLSTIAVA